MGFYESLKVYAACHQLRIDDKIAHLYSYVDGKTAHGTVPLPIATRHFTADDILPGTVKGALIQRLGFSRIPEDMARLYTDAVYRSVIMTDYTTRVLPRAKKMGLKDIVRAATGR